MILINKNNYRIICNDFISILGNLTEIGLIWWYDVKWVKDEQIWLIAPLSRIQELKEERNLLSVWVVVLEGMTKIWLEALSLDLDCCRRANNVWYCPRVKPICYLTLSLHDSAGYYYSLLSDF